MKTEPAYNKKKIFSPLRFHFKQCSLDNLIVCNFERIKLYLHTSTLILAADTAQASAQKICSWDDLVTRNLKVKCKGKSHLITGLERPERE